MKYRSFFSIPYRLLSSAITEVFPLRRSQLACPNKRKLIQLVSSWRTGITPSAKSYQRDRYPKDVEQLIPSWLGSSLVMRPHTTAKNFSRVKACIQNGSQTFTKGTQHRVYYFRTPVVQRAFVEHCSQKFHRAGAHFVDLLTKE